MGICVCLTVKCVKIFKSCQYQRRSLVSNNSMQVMIYLTEIAQHTIFLIFPRIVSGENASLFAAANVHRPSRTLRGWDFHSKCLADIVGHTLKLDRVNSVSCCFQQPNMLSAQCEDKEIAVAKKQWQQRLEVKLIRHYCLFRKTYRNAIVRVVAEGGWRCRHENSQALTVLLPEDLIAKERLTGRKDRLNVFFFHVECFKLLLRIVQQGFEADAVQGGHRPWTASASKPCCTMRRSSLKHSTWKKKTLRRSLRPVR